MLLDVEVENNYNFKLTKGPYASTVYLNQNNIYNYQLTLDWTYDGIYFKYLNDDWIVLSIGKKNPIHDIHKIDTTDKIMIFKKLCFYCLNNLQNFSEISNDSLIKLQKIVDLFI